MGKTCGHCKRCGNSWLVELFGQECPVCCPSVETVNAVEDKFFDLRRELMDACDPAGFRDAWRRLTKEGEIVAQGYDTGRDVDWRRVEKTAAREPRFYDLEWDTEFARIVHFARALVSLRQFNTGQSDMNDVFDRRLHELETRDHMKCADCGGRVFIDAENVVRCTNPFCREEETKP